ncbi:MAG: hypothetical protein B7X94_00125 [Hydrogenophilales bacterium 17-62-8]|nr:MAG: hypothetical protein B7X94_00125 [Hydrogenophilales bacterium 17-62-8]
MKSQQGFIAIPFHLPGPDFRKGNEMKHRSNALLLAVLASISFNAHALCVNPDGSLDDASMSPSTIAVETLPLCAEPTPKTANASEPGSRDAMLHTSAEAVQPVGKAKIDN